MNEINSSEMNKNIDCENALLTKPHILCETGECGEDKSSLSISSVTDLSFDRGDDKIPTSPSPSDGLSLSGNSPLASPKRMSSSDDELEYVLGTDIFCSAKDTNDKTASCSLYKEETSTGRGNKKRDDLKSSSPIFEETLHFEDENSKAQSDLHKTVLKNNLDLARAGSYDPDMFNLMSPTNLLSYTFPTSHTRFDGYTYFSPEDITFTDSFFGLSRDFGENNVRRPSLMPGFTAPSLSPRHKLVTPSSSFRDDRVASNLDESSLPPLLPHTAYGLAGLPQVQYKVQDDASKTEIPEQQGTGRNEAAWNQRFFELQQFKELHGHTNVPQKYEKNPSLGAWVARNRLFMRQLEDDECEIKPSSVQYKRMMKLKELGLASCIGEFF
jgi:hypothetical protein